MGDDSPLPNLAGRPRHVHHFQRQRFAQVTNSPIDNLRERLVVSLRTILGPRQPILAPREARKRQTSWTCGSLAALPMTVSPSASTAAITAFSVPVTLASSRNIRVPVSVPSSS